MYQIIDEPKQNFLSKFAMNPFWLLIIVFILKSVGAILLIANSFALNSPTKKKEILLAIGGVLLGMICSSGFYLFITPHMNISDDSAKTLSRTIGMLFLYASAYKIYFMQQQAYDLKKYFEDK